MKGIRQCTWITDSDEECGELTEGHSPFCASHSRQLRKEKENERKNAEKRASQISKAKAKNLIPRKTISKNPADWNNTFLCSDGHRVAQSSIESNYKQSKVLKYGGKEVRTCEGCGTLCNSNAHIIAQARCKQIGKTELIWHFDNYFPACYKCNAAIENPKGKVWKSLKNIEKCLSFIKQHDPELYAKFEQSAVNQENPTI